MKCDESERIIYLFDESSKEKQDAVHQHMTTCASCRKVFEREAQHGAIIRKMSKPELDTIQSRLTDRIMAAIEKEEAPIRFTFLEQFLRVSPKYALALSSVILVAFFISEYNHPIVGDRATTETRMASTFGRQASNTAFNQIIGSRNHPATSLFKFIRERHAGEESIIMKIRTAKLNKK